MQSAPLLRAWRRLAFPRWAARWRAGGAAGAGTAQTDGDGNAAVVTLMLGPTCAAVRLERRAGAPQLHLARAASVAAINCGSGNQPAGLMTPRWCWCWAIKNAIS